MARYDPDNHAVFSLDRQIAGLGLLTAAFGTLVFAPHVHEEMVIAVTQAGAGRCVTRGTASVGTPQTVMVFNPGEPHQGGVTGDAPWCYRSFYLGPDLLTTLGDETFGRRITLPWFREAVVNDPDLARSMLAAHRAIDGGAGRLMRETLLLEALALLFRRHGAPAPHLPVPGREGRPVQRVAAALRDDPAADWSVATLAALAGMSPFHFCRAFRKETGLAPHAFLTQARLDLARRRLAAGMAPAEVAAATGFCDQSHLTRQFKRCYGITPGLWAAAVAGARSANTEAR